MVDRIIWVAPETKNLKKVPLESTLQAKNSTKVKGVIDRSLHFKAVRTRSSILKMVRGSNTKRAPSTCLVLQRIKINKVFNFIVH